MGAIKNKPAKAAVKPAKSVKPSANGKKTGPDAAHEHHFEMPRPSYILDTSGEATHVVLTNADYDALCEELEYLADCLWAQQALDERTGETVPYTELRDKLLGKK